MKWTEIVIKTTSEACDAVSEMLSSIGAGGVAIEDPEDIRREVSKPGNLDYVDDDFLKSLGNDVVIKAYFSDDRNIPEIVEIIKEKISYISSFLNTGKGIVGFTQVDDEDWANAWKKYYKPLHLTEKIVVKPSWEKYNKKDGEIVIELDPGMAFGTGTHETTKMCAALLEKYMKSGYSVIDVGCGTGILSIIAAKLGANQVVAVDVDEVAVKVAAENCSLNGEASKVKVFAGTLYDVDKQKADIVVANIISKVIIEMSDVVPDYVKPGGFFITSGIIKERKQEVLEAYLKLGFTCEENIEMGEWVAMSFRCQNSL